MISKREFAKRVGVSENYVYTLTGESNKITTLSPMLAKALRWSSAMMPSGYCMGTNRYDKSRMSFNALSAFSVTV